MTPPCRSPVPPPAWRRRALLLLALAAGAAAAQKQPRPAAGTPVGQLLPDALMRGLNGPSRRLSEFRGKPLVINVWASWCAPCREEMASLERLAWMEHAVPFAIIGISTDDYEDRALRLLRQTNATISHYIDRKLELENILGATHLPLTVLVDADGRVVHKVYGAREWDDAESRRLIEQSFRRPAGGARR